MFSNSIFGNGCNTCGNWGNWGNNCGCNNCGNWGNNCGCGCGNGVLGTNTGTNLGNSAFCFVGEWVNIVVTLTILQSILGLVCNWNCGCNN